MAVYDDVIFQVVKDAQADLETRLEADVMYFNGEIRMNLFSWFREVVEKMSQRSGKRNAVAIFLTTPGGQAEIAEKLVEVVRAKYELVYFVIPTVAMSAGTIFCMSGDKIFMDYSSSLGPIDPQVPDREGKYLLPALGHLDKVNEMIEKSRNNIITPAEFQWVQSQDLAMLRFYEQARDLSIALLKGWLVQYKFKDWIKHRTTNVGTDVTLQEKQVRATEIATLLSNNTHWHSHGRLIGMRTVQDTLRLEIDDFGGDRELQLAIRRYSDTLTEYLARQNIPSFIYSSHAAT